MAVQENKTKGCHARRVAKKYNEERKETSLLEFSVALHFLWPYDRSENLHCCSLFLSGRSGLQLW